LEGYNFFPNEFVFMIDEGNGLSYTVERLKDRQIHGQVTLTKSKRSTLAWIAAEYL
jgi:predicted ribonuclease YlaK